VPIIPAQFQPALPLDRILVADAPNAEAIAMDVVFVGAGPAGLAGAIELARLVQRDNQAGGPLGGLQIAVVDKAPGLGDHSLSGAIINQRAIRELFPNLDAAQFPFRSPVTAERVYFLTHSRAIRVPTPPTMRNHGHAIASLCEVVRWLGEQAEALGVYVFTGFPVDTLLTTGMRVTGVRTTPAGLTRSGTPGPAYTPGTDIAAQVVVLAEGTRGMLSQAWIKWQEITSANPQIFALGVKEVWRTKRPLNAVVHTLGWPLPSDVFGGSFVYPLAPDLLALGLVVGMDYPQTTLDVHELLQRLKRHPIVRGQLEGGEMIEWGAKTIPEGGYYAIPARRSGDGVIVVGDAAGYVEVSSLKGIHYAMQSGIYAARAIFEALRRGDTSAGALVAYDRMVEASYIMRDLYRRRNMRLAFQESNLYRGGMQAALMTLTNGRVPGGQRRSRADAEVPRAPGPEERFLPDGTLTFSKDDANYKSGNKTRDDIPSHLIVGKDIPPELATLYEHMCPAGVYRREGQTLQVSPGNCVDCKATDVIGPRWTPREGTSGPRYRWM
jgi:electron-transferring-flavoprotein dehydrogenase